MTDETDETAPATWRDLPENACLAGWIDTLRAQTGPRGQGFPGDSTGPTPCGVLLALVAGDNRWQGTAALGFLLSDLAGELQLDIADVLVYERVKVDGKLPSFKQFADWLEKRAELLFWKLKAAGYLDHEG